MSKLGYCKECGNHLAVRGSQVACGKCGVLHLEHPHQQALDAQKAENLKPPAVPKLAPLVFNTEDSERISVLERYFRELTERVQQLEMLLTEPKGKRKAAS